jgi:hypothetical protein
MERDSPTKLSCNEASPKKKLMAVPESASPPVYVNIPTINFIRNLKFEEPLDSDVLVSIPSEYDVLNPSQQFGDVPSLTLALEKDFSGKLLNHNND